MPMYVYNAPDGGTVEIYASMQKPPPERLVLTPRGYRKAKPSDPLNTVYSRQYSNPRLLVRDYEINHGGGKPPISHSAMPLTTQGKPETLNGKTVYRHPSGVITDRGGRPYVRSKSDVDRVVRANRDLGVQEGYD